MATPMQYSRQLLHEIRGYLAGFAVLALVGALALPLITGYSKRQDGGLEAVHLLELIFNFDGLYPVPGSDPDTHIAIRVAAALALLIPLALLLTPQYVSHPTDRAMPATSITVGFFIQFVCLSLCWLYTWHLTWNESGHLSIVSWGPGMFSLTAAHLLVALRVGLLGRLLRWMSQP